MKKTFFIALLSAAAAGSWAFYPKATAPAGYMMVISRFSGNGFSSKGTIITISPDGQAQSQEIETKNGSISKVANSFDQISLAEVKTFNELRTAGWRVKTATPVVIGQGALTETVYLLEKE